MKRLSKAQNAERHNLTEELIALHTAVEQALAELNEKIAEARDFRDSIVNSMEEYMLDRSDKWQDSDAGQNYSDWKDNWENAELEEIELSNDFSPDVLAELEDAPNG